MKYIMLFITLTSLLSARGLNLYNVKNYCINLVYNQNKIVENSADLEDVMGAYIQGYWVSVERLRKMKNMSPETWFLDKEKVILEVCTEALQNNHEKKDYPFDYVVENKLGIVMAKKMQKLSKER